MITTGTRHLKNITDSELAVIVEISRHYGAKEFWGDVKVTRIDRDRFRGEIVIDYEQHHLKDGGVARRRMFLDLAHLTYFVSMREPVERLSKTYSVCENTQMVLWLVAQDFDILECLSYAKVEPRNGHTGKAIGILACRGDYCGLDLEKARFFMWEDEDRAWEYRRQNEDDGIRLFSLTEIRKEE